MKEQTDSTNTEHPPFPKNMFILSFSSLPMALKLYRPPFILLALPGCRLLTGTCLPVRAGRGQGRWLRHLGPEGRPRRTSRRQSTRASYTSPSSHLLAPAPGSRPRTAMNTPFAHCTRSTADVAAALPRRGRWPAAQRVGSPPEASVLSVASPKTGSSSFPP